LPGGVPATSHKNWYLVTNYDVTPLHGLFRGKNLEMGLGSIHNGTLIHANDVDSGKNKNYQVKLIAKDCLESIYKLALILVVGSGGPLLFVR